MNDKLVSMKEEFVGNHGYWNQALQEVMDANPAYFQAFLSFANVPVKGGHLPTKVRALVDIAINVSCTHLNDAALRSGIQAALRAGAEKAEIIEVFQLVSVLGIHAVSLGYPIVMSEAEDSGRSDQLAHPPMSERQLSLKKEFIDKRGYWNDFWESVLLQDPMLFEAYGAFSSIPWEKGVLEPKVKEFIYVAIDAATTHMFEPGTRQHVKNAFNHGATVQELFEVLQIAAAMGVQSCLMGVPVLLGEISRFEANT